MSKEITIQEIEKILGYDIKIVKEKTVKLRDINPGDSFKFGGVEFILLSHNVTNSSSCCITKEVSEQTFCFDNNGNTHITSADIFYVLNCKMQQCLPESANMDKFVNEIFAPKYFSYTSLDGLKRYNSSNIGTSSLFSLLTYDEYIEYREILDKYNPKKFWWLATPFTINSTSEFRPNDTDVCYINNFGEIRHSPANSFCAIRPVCNFYNDLDVIKI